MPPSFSVLVGSREKPVSESLRVVIEHLLKKRLQLHFADRDSWQELAAYADEHGYDLLLVNLTQTINHNRAGRTLGEMTAENVRQFKARYHNPIIILTSWDEPGMFAQLEAAGADVVITMPFTLSQITPHIEKCISQFSSGAQS
jgi:CheY-like chemotaxis protein